MGRKGKKKNTKGSSGLNKKEGEEFLLKNANRSEVVITDSDLQYEVIKRGEGQQAKNATEVVVNQRAWLLDGTVLEDTYKSGKPSRFFLSEVIEGYEEGIRLMQEGDRYKFYVPPELGWGRKGSGHKIGPNSVIIFDVSLIEVLC